MGRPAPKQPAPLHEGVAAVFMANEIRRARTRQPQPSYSQIARELGCTEKTVYRVLTGKTHAAE
jgi:predicted transcriptional regulator